jgi:hypothetical protein
VVITDSKSLYDFKDAKNLTCRQLPMSPRELLGHSPTSNLVPVRSCSRSCPASLNLGSPAYVGGACRNESPKDIKVYDGEIVGEGDTSNNTKVDKIYNTFIIQEVSDVRLRPGVVDLPSFYSPGLRSDA